MQWNKLSRILVSCCTVLYSFSIAHVISLHSTLPLPPLSWMARPRDLWRSSKKTWWHRSRSKWHKMSARHCFSGLSFLSIKVRKSSAGSCSTLPNSACQALGESEYQVCVSVCEIFRSLHVIQVFGHPYLPCLPGTAGGLRRP